VIARAAALYFALVFGAGFALGTIRVPWLEPLVGERAAVMIEAPLMLVAIVLAACFIARRSAGRIGTRGLLAAGAAAALFVLAADVAVGVALRGMTPAQVFVERDPVSGTVYYALVALFALAPAAFGRRARPS